MAKLSREQQVIRQIIKDYGAQIDLQAAPEVFLEIVRKHAFDLSPSADDVPDGGAKPGGVGPVGPTSRQLGPSINDIMKELLKLQRQVASMAKRLPS
jgi:hypothetical protein